MINIIKNVLLCIASINVILLLFMKEVNAQNKGTCEYKYYLEEIGFGLYLSPDSTVNIYTQDSLLFVIDLNECYGLIRFTSYFKDTVKMLEGSYDIVPDTLQVVKATWYDVEEQQFVTKNKGKEYLVLKDGQWKYWSKDGNLEKVEIWNNGELVRREEY